MLPTKAYDFEMLAASIAETGPRGQGWCFGLPPGIDPDEWPLDLHNGFPLRHSFTLLLPEDYRCHGQAIVAVSFFGVSLEHHDGGAEISEPVADALRSEQAPSDPLLRRLWQVERSSHHRLARMNDILDCGYAAILLTQAEFEGPFCPPPRHNYPAHFHGAPRPRWLEVGTARDYWDSQHFPGDRPLAEFGLYKIFGQIPDENPAFNRAISWSPRAEDPNAGKAPQEDYGLGAPASGYQAPHYWKDGVVKVENWREHEWAKGHAAQHIGGTMRPIQAIPAGFSPYYIEFDEAFGGFNFGGGNAQLDFQTMKFDWACG
ncbi:hypothetical protein [Terrarubrum flagellatum]|uniref:hypothetical protein n=1 Tax=Terrirubrum flagellatum TaxID=2895980 RepID=UPI0031453E26